MVESFDRIVFKSSKGQEDFLNKVRGKINCSLKELAKLIGKSDKTVRDWLRGKYKMSYADAVRLSKLSDVLIPKSAHKEDFKEHLRVAGKKGGLAHVKKYGKVKVDEEKRKEKWKEWWEEKGRHDDRFSAIGKKKSFCVPKKSSRLAEFVGIVLGDGGISDYQVVITLHKHDDKEYGEFVSKLVTDLFDVPVGKHENKNDKGVNYIISRIGIVDFFVQKLGLKKGNKVENQVDVPKWIKDNKKFSIACTRGLVDTDGCLVIHKYRVGGKLYKYKKITYTSRSLPLVKFMFKTLSENGIKPRTYKDQDVWIDSKKGVDDYMRIFGSHNQKHLMRYLK